MLDQDLRDQFQEIKNKFAIDSIAKKTPIKYEDYNGKYVIYCIVNLLNGKKYIGSTTNLTGRVYHYIYDYLTGSREKRELVTDIETLGIDKFILFPIDLAEDREDMRIKEARYIINFDTQNPDKGYNKALPSPDKPNQYKADFKASRAKFVAAINPESKHLVISEGMKLFADYTYSTKDLVKNEARACMKHRGYYIIYLNAKDRNFFYEKMYSRWLSVQEDLSANRFRRSSWRDKSGEYIAAADLINDMIESESVEALESSGYKCEYLHYDLSNEKPCLMDPISVFFDTVDLSQFDGIKDTNEET